MTVIYDADGRIVAVFCVYDGDIEVAVSRGFVALTNDGRVSKVEPPQE